MEVKMNVQYKRDVKLMKLACAINKIDAFSASEVLSVIYTDKSLEEIVDDILNSTIEGLTNEKEKSG